MFYPVATGNPGNMPSLYTGVIGLSQSSRAPEPLIYRPHITYQNQELYELLRTQSPADDENWLLNGTNVYLR